jgi:Cof subfamily protein (haloacid dehalogenase superfamily)
MIAKKMRHSRILAIDLDGTLLRDDETISTDTLASLMSWQLAGHRLVIATGRAPRLAARVLPEELHQVPWICYNGAEVYLKGTKIYHDYITVPDTQQIARFLQREYPDAHIRLEINDHVLTERAIPVWSADSYTVVERLDSVENPCAKIIFWLDDVSMIQPVIDNLPQATQALVLPTYNAVEILSRTVNKGTALGVLLERWELNYSQVIAVGDNANDQEMIEQSGFGVAMGNATEQIQAVADYVTASNAADGVALLIDQLLSGDRPLFGGCAALEFVRS